MFGWMRCVSVGAIFVATASLAQPEGFTISSGAKDGNYYSVSGGICRMVNRGNGGRCEVRESKGSIDNLYALRLGDADFGIVQSDVHKAAFEGDAEIENTPYSDLRSVFSIYPEMLTIAVRDDFAGTVFGDLRNATISAGQQNSGTSWSFFATLAASGIPEETVTIRREGAGMGAMALCNRTVDAVVIMTGHPSAFLNRLAGTCSIRLLSVEKAIIDAMTKANPAYRPVVIPAEFYDPLTVDIVTVGTLSTMVTLADTPHETVTAVLESIFDDYDGFRRQHFALGAAVPIRDSLTAPMHVAAERFFRDRGLIR